MDTENQLIQEPIPDLAGVLAENARRQAEISSSFNPLSGEGAGGPRFPLEVSDSPYGTLWLPEEMSECRPVQLLRQYGSFAAAARIMPDLEDQLTRERMLHDFPFWAASFATIKRKGGGEDVKFVLNRPQRLFVEKLESFRRAGEPIRIIMLKARQWGGSTCAQLYMAWLQLVHRKGLNSLIIAHQSAGTDEIKDMFDRMIAAYPARLMREAGEEPAPGEKKIEGVGHSRSAYRVPARKCKIKVGTAERPDSCRGGDYNLVHLSEVGIWKQTEGKKPEDIVRSACSGILLQPLTMIVLESTANGTGNYFHREYLDAKEGKSQFKPFFIGWMDIEQYSLPFADADEKAAFAAALIEGRMQTTCDSRHQSGEYLWYLWKQGATLEAIHWYVAERLKYSDHAQMAAEYPSDELEAFSHSGLRVFNPEAVERLAAGCSDPVATGDVATAGNRNALDFSCPRFIPDDRGFLKIWAYPDPDERMPVSDRYLCVMDVGGKSSKADWTVITVFDRQPMADGGEPEVVAQWRGHDDLDLVAYKAAEIASYYGQALLVIESNTIETHDSLTDNGQGSFILNQIRDHYPCLYARKASPEQIKAGRERYYGFHTNRQTKQDVINMLVKCVRDGLYVERDRDACNELLQYERRHNGTYGAVMGCHDDILMTRAIGLHICYNEMERPIRLPAKSPNAHLYRRRSASAGNEAQF